MLADVSAVLDEVGDRDGVVGVGQGGGAVLADGEALVAQDVGGAPFAFFEEDGGGRDEGPRGVFARREEGGLLRLRAREGAELVGEVRGVEEARAVLVDEQGARSSDDVEVRSGRGDEVGEVRGRCGVEVEGLGGEGAEGVDDGLEAGEVLGGDVEDVAEDRVRGVRAVLPSDDGGDIVSARDELVGDEAAGLAVGRDDGDLHGASPSGVHSLTE